jgi:5-methylthioribose kinase
MELDIEQPDALREWLVKTGRVKPGEPVRIRTLAGGVSNKTVLVEIGAEKAWVLKQALEKLRVAVDWFSDPARIEREALGMRWLQTLAPEGAITELIFEDRDEHILAMAAVPQPHENLKTLFMTGHADQELAWKFGGLLGTVHRRGWEERAKLAPIFDNRAFFESLRIEPYYQYTAAQVPASGPFITALIAEMLTQRLALVHGDYSPKNILVYECNLILLDHEVIHFGDPAFDVGFALAHLLSKAHHFVASRKNFESAAQTFHTAYRDALGPVPWAADSEARGARHALACLLARVKGRSTLEYLSGAEREQQAIVVLEMMRTPPASIAALIPAFVSKLSE